MQSFQIKGQPKQTLRIETRRGQIDLISQWEIEANIYWLSYQGDRLIVWIKMGTRMKDWDWPERSLGSCPS